MSRLVFLQFVLLFVFLSLVCLVVVSCSVVSDPFLSLCVVIVCLSLTSFTCVPLYLLLSRVYNPSLSSVPVRLCLLKLFSYWRPSLCYLTLFLIRLFCLLRWLISRILNLSSVKTFWLLTELSRVVHLVPNQVFDSSVEGDNTQRIF